MLWNWTTSLPGFLTAPEGWLGPYLNVLPLITIGLFLWQQKLFMPPAVDEQQKMQQQVMNYMMWFMALMFFISGLFVWKSLAKKGAAAFLMDRGRRLGIPFVLSLAVIMPLAYYPAFLLTGAEDDPLSYWVGWSWNSGPAWFLSMLLGFDLLLAIFFQAMRQTHRAIPEVLVTQPQAFFLTLVVFSGLGFMPLMAVYGPLQWLEWGPFVFVQACRLVLYAVYFVAGVVVGGRGLETTFLTPDGPLARRWWVWLFASIGAALALVIALSVVRLDPRASWTRPAGWWQLGSCMVLYSATLSMAFLALFLRFMHVNIRGPIT